MQKSIANNRQAFHDYEILDTYEAGIVLKGKEIKDVRNHKVSLQGSYARVLGNSKPELFWVGGSIGIDERDRSRKLLVHKRELTTLIGKTQQKGLTLIPLSLYFKNGRAKLSIGLAKGKNLYDKRKALKKKDLQREVRRGLTI